MHLVYFGLIPLNQCIIFLFWSLILLTSIFLVFCFAIYDLFSFLVLPLSDILVLYLSHKIKVFLCFHCSGIIFRVLLLSNLWMFDIVPFEIIWERDLQEKPGSRADGVRCLPFPTFGPTCWDLWSSLILSHESFWRTLATLLPFLCCGRKPSFLANEALWYTLPWREC